MLGNTPDPRGGHPEGVARGWLSRGAREDAQYHPDARRDDTQRTSRGCGREDASHPAQARDVLQIRYRATRSMPLPPHAHTISLLHSPSPRSRQLHHARQTPRASTSRLAAWQWRVRPASSRPRPSTRSMRSTASMAVPSRSSRATPSSAVSSLVRRFTVFLFNLEHVMLECFGDNVPATKIFR